MVVVYLFLFEILPVDYGTIKNVQHTQILQKKPDYVSKLWQFMSIPEFIYNSHALHKVHLVV